MNVYDLILSRRTVRKFSQKPIDDSILEKMIDAARLAPSGGNLQPIKFVLVNTRENAKSIFDNVKWAAYLNGEGTPKPDEMPTAFICILIDKNITKSDSLIEIGAACQNIFLIAEEMGIGTCWMGAINRNKISEIISIDDSYLLNTVIALGYKAENPKTVELKSDIKYYKDENGTLTVPKRSLNEVLIKKM